MAPPATLFPVQEREAYIVKEAVPGTIMSQNVTATSASPCVFTPGSMAGVLPGHAAVLGGTPPGGLSTSTVYYVTAITATTFQLAAAPGGSALASTSTGSSVTVTFLGYPIPVTTLKPSDKPLWLEDTSEQGSMGDIYGIYQGPLIAGIDIGGNVYGDTFAHALYNLLGDYTVTGTAAAPAGTTNAAMAAGATAIPVASGGTSFTAGMAIWLEDAGTPAASEVVYVTTTGSATSIPITPTRFAHATAMPFTNTTGPYVHVFSSLNGLIGAANGAAQGPTHCITDRTGIPAAGLAAQYAYGCFSDITITGNAEKLLEWTGKITCQARQIAPAPVGFTAVSAVQTYPSWRSVTGVGGPASGGTQVKNIAEWSVSLTRAIKAYNTNQGSQQPYVIARGKQGVTGKHLISPAIDESQLIALLANTQPQLQYVASNGLSGVNLVQVQVDIGLGAYQTADLDEGSELFGYQVPWKAVHTAATFTGPQGGVLSGASGGKSAVKIAITNNVPTY